MRLLFFLLLLFPYQAHAGCVESYCADGYTGCGCGPDSAECCRKRMTGENGNSAPTAGLDTQLFDMGMKLFEENLQRQKQKELLHRQMMKEGDEQIGRLKQAEGAELDAYHESKNKERISKQADMRKVKEQLLRIEPGFAPLEIENSPHQVKYARESEEKYGKKADKMPLEVMTEKVKTTESPARPPQLCQASTSAYPNRCIATACGITSTESLCCPEGFPYLNHCDCLCYESTDFKCNSYSACQYSNEN